MTTDSHQTDQAFLEEVQDQLGRRLDAHETTLVISLKNEKSAAMVARELQGAVIADPEKIRPEHKDAADE